VFLFSLFWDTSEPAPLGHTGTASTNIGLLYHITVPLVCISGVSEYPLLYLAVSSELPWRAHTSFSHYLSQSELAITLRNSLVLLGFLETSHLVSVCFGCSPRVSVVLYVSQLFSKCLDCSLRVSTLLRDFSGGTQDFFENTQLRND